MLLLGVEAYETSILVIGDLSYFASKVFNSSHIIKGKKSSF